MQERKKINKKMIVNLIRVFIILFGIMMFDSCFPWKENFIYEKGWYTAFKRKDMITIRDELKVQSLKGLLVLPNIIDSSSGVGLWNYTFSHSSVGHYDTFLKFRTYVCLYDKDDSIINVKNVTRFLNEYDSIFTEKQKIEIKSYFLAGRHSFGHGF